jgi:hypothetical protein
MLFSEDIKLFEQEYQYQSITKPCYKDDFDYLNGNVYALLPKEDFFSKVEQQELIDTFPLAQIEYVKNGHFGTILECEKYFDAIRSLSGNGKG